MRFLMMSVAVPTLFLGFQSSAYAEWPFDGFPCCPFSDATLKTNVQPLTGATQKLLQIQGVTFNWKEGGREDIGVIAQEVKKVHPQLVREDTAHMRVDYEKLVAPLIESVREMDARIKQLETANTTHAR